MNEPKSHQVFETAKRISRHRGGLVGAFLLLAYLVMTVFGPLIAPHNPYEQDLLLSLRPGFWSESYPPSYFLGTDLHGRDILSRILYGARITMGMGMASVFLSTILGVTLGILAGYYGGIFDDVLMIINDAMLAFPPILIAIILIAIFGAGLDKAIFAVAFVYTPRMLRVARAATLSVRSLDYIVSAKSIGASTFRIQVSHIFPNILAPVLVQVSFGLSQAITTIAGLGFLGLGAQPPTPEWGAMLSDALRYLMARIWWYPLFPGLLITGIVLGFNMAGDGLRDALDPKLRRIKT